MSWLIDNTPWWVYLIVLGGGGGAALALIPGAFAAVAGVWSMLPPRARWALAGIGALAAVFVGGRYQGARNERDKNKARADNAVRNRLEVENEVSKMPPSAVDKKLSDRGDFRD